jgi:hypothetical protein
VRKRQAEVRRSRGHDGLSVTLTPVRQPAIWITATHKTGGDSASQATGPDQRDTQAIEGLRTRLESAG